MCAIEYDININELYIYLFFKESTNIYILFYTNLQII